MFKIAKEESEFIEVEIGKSTYVGNIQWEIAKMALLKNKKVIYTFKGNEYVVTLEEAKEIITPERVTEEISNLEREEKNLAKELLKKRKEKRELEELLKFLEDKISKDSPK